MDEQTVSSVRRRFKARQTENPCIGDTLVSVTRKYGRGTARVLFRVVDKHKNYPIRGGRHSCRPIMALFRTHHWPTRFQSGGSFWLEWEYACPSCGELRRRVARDGRRPAARGVACFNCEGRIPDTHDFPASDAAAVHGERLRRVFQMPHPVLWEGVSEAPLGVEWNTCE